MIKQGISTVVFVATYLVVMLLLPAHAQVPQQPSEGQKTKKIEGQNSPAQQNASQREKELSQKGRGPGLQGKPVQKQGQRVSGSSRQSEKQQEPVSQVKKGVGSPIPGRASGSSKQPGSGLGAKGPNSDALGRSAGSSSGGSKPGKSRTEQGTGASRSLYYQQAPPQSQSGTPGQEAATGGSRTGQTAGAGTSKSSSASTASGGGGSSSSQTSVQPPANQSEAYSRLKAAKEALEYYTTGNGRFVKDREAQIEKLRKEIGFLESYQKSGSGTSSSSGSQSKTPPARSASSGSSTTNPTVTKSSVTNSTPTTKLSQGGQSKGPGGVSSKPTGYTKVYDDKGSNIAQKPYWGSGTKADPYRDYQDPNKPFGDRIWGSGTRNDPYTNIVKPPKSVDQDFPPSKTGVARSLGHSAGLNSGQQAGVGRKPSDVGSQSKTPTESSRYDKNNDAVEQAEEQLKNLEHEFDQKMKRTEEAIDSFFDKTKAEFEKELKSCQEGRNITASKMIQLSEKIRQAEERGNREEVENLNKDMGALLNDYGELSRRIVGIQNWLDKEQDFRNDEKENLKLTHQAFKQENEMLRKEITKGRGLENDKRLKEHLDKWNSQKLEELYQYEPSGSQSPLVTPRTYNPVTEKSKVDKAKWRDERKAQLEKEYENKIQDVLNEPTGEGARALGASVDKHRRVEELRKEKEARERQIDVTYRESLIKSGRLSQDEYNALNTPEWEEKLEKYHQDLREGRVAGERPTP